MIYQENAPRYNVSLPVGDAGGDFCDATVSEIDRDFPKILNEKAKSNFGLIEELLDDNGYKIPENWQVGDMLAFLITRYVKALDKNIFRANDNETDELNITIFPPYPSEAGEIDPISFLSFEVIKSGATYSGKINIPNSNSKNDNAGLPINVYKRTEIPLSLWSLGQSSFAVSSLSGRDLVDSPATLNAFAKDVLLPQPVSEFSLS